MVTTAGGKGGHSVVMELYIQECTFLRRTATATMSLSRVTTTTVILQILSNAVTVTYRYDCYYSDDSG